MPDSPPDVVTINVPAQASVPVATSDEAPVIYDEEIQEIDTEPPAKLETPKLPEKKAAEPDVKPEPKPEGPKEMQAEPIVTLIPSTKKNQKEKEGAREGELTKGGESKEDAVSYLILRQLPGNHPPLYPLKARLENRQGQLELLYRVTKEGQVVDLQVLATSGFKDLDQEALRAIADFRFVPGQEGWARHPVAFFLKGPAAPLPSKLRSKGAQN